jgi:hypothetical protein
MVVGCMFDFVEERKREQQALEVSGVWRDFFVRILC